jgi:hypothetical protein
MCAFVHVVLVSRANSSSKFQQQIPAANSSSQFQQQIPAASSSRSFFVVFFPRLSHSSHNLRENFGTRHVKLQGAHLAVWRVLAHSLKKHPQQNCGLFGQFCRPAALWSTQKLSHNYPKVTWLFTKS